jgi:hypothetical protein
MRVSLCVLASEIEEAMLRRHSFSCQSLRAPRLSGRPAKMDSLDAVEREIENIEIPKTAILRDLLVIHVEGT